MEDMRTKPPAGIAVGIPNQVRNLQVLIGDSSAIITFDPPTNVRGAQVTSYGIKNNKTGITTYANTSPFIVKGLKNGTSYTFSVSAINNNGSSDPLITDSVIPVATWKQTLIDNASDAKFIVTTSLNNKPFIAYISSKTGTLRTAIYSNGLWKKVVIDGMGGSLGRTNHKLGGHLSLCSSGTGTRQIVHLFYGDLIDNDLRHATISDSSINFEVVDGNAPQVQSYEEENRTRTGSDVSVASACVATTTTLQVFYRDESQGVLLGAVKKSNKWSYELIDGDRKIDGRTTGDVGFHLDAYLNGLTTYLIYDSVLAVNQKKDATAGEIRLASRDGSMANTWIYETLESPSTAASMLGYDVAINKVAGKLTGAWFAASGATLPNPSQVHTQVIDGESASYSTSKFGTPNGRLDLNGTTLVLTCQKRLCSIDTITKKVSLINGWQSDDPIQNGWITLSGVRYLVAGINGQLIALRA
jgi:hypothetical protein